ncbi:unnamed protein product [Aureobasidium mustum]|uniref:BTB domain-containing protein n=1 Tax=Aureobasidium mustum TaxID=2773714 RepID=A0A9N8JYH3_9PEZI|nr:unnamed protein product [Aureobasidium mustum]
MSSKDSKEPLLGTIASLHESGAYSDFKIVCGPETYNVHRNIVCPQSDFFRAACRPHTFREGKTGIVTIPANAGRDMGALSSPLAPEEFSWDLDVEDVKTIKAMIHYFYHHDYPSDKPTHVDHAKLTSANIAKGVLAEHAKMYAIGEKYGIAGLKGLAAKRFGEDFQNTFAGLGTAIVIAFKSTPETDQTLRKLIVDKLCSYRWVAANGVVDEAVEQIPELVHSLYRRLLGQTGTSR